MKRFYLLLPLFLVAGLFVAWIGVRDSEMPESLAMVGPTPLPTVTPTLTPTPGWWSETDLATPTLKKLPGVPRPKLKGGADGAAEPGQKVPFEIISCPTEGVKISDIRTASGPWWHISGTASIPNLWYWKAEISADGANWASLYRSEAPVVKRRAGASELDNDPGGCAADQADRSGQDGQLSGALYSGAQITIGPTHQCSFN